MDSSGLGTLIGLQRYADQNGHALTLQGLSTSFLRILQITHTAEAFTIVTAGSRAATNMDAALDG